MPSFLKPSLSWLLVFVPIAAYFELATDKHTWVFVTSCLAIIPLAGWMGKATEHLAERTGEGVGGLLNATFGNAAELIISLVALSKGMHEVVKASITGSIIGNVLLVLGASCLAGGLKYETLTFNVTGVRAYGSMLLLAAASMVLPSMFHHQVGTTAVIAEHHLSLVIAIVLLVTYVLSLVFSLHTHKQLFVGNAAESAAVADDGPEHHPWSLKKAVGVLMAATALIAVIAEWMVDSVSHAARSLGMTNLFVGVVLVAVVGNAAEHSTAIMVAMKRRMDLAMGVAIGSSIQIALFVAPVLVLASYFIGPHPLDLVFTTSEIIALTVAIMVTEQVTADGETHWLEGVQLLSLYVIIAMVFYFLPEAAGPGGFSSPGGHVAP